MKRMDKMNRPLLIRSCLAILLAGLIVVVGIVATVSLSPQLAAQGADLLRPLIGPKSVAKMEDIVFKIQDTVTQLEFKLGRITPSVPWQIAAVTQSSPSGNSPGSTQDSTTALAPSANRWMPLPVPPLGSLAGEGAWTPYMQDATGATVAYRTFLQPDPQRPYVVVGVVAFDLTRTRLNYVVGTKEPKVSGGHKAPGIIPAADRASGILLAAFNGGFRTINGHFGVMYKGSVLIAPILNMATVALYRDGSIRIGEWGNDLKYSQDMVTYRQNCKLMVQNGAVDPLVYDNSVNNWGYTIKGSGVTSRSGLGISQDGKVLYYFAGPSLTMPILAKAMQDAGAYQAMQLDINNTKVYFSSFKFDNGQLVAIPLLPQNMVYDINRFLGPSSRDFFYITASNP
jgi:hypothetical protein